MALAHCAGGSFFLGSLALLHERDAEQQDGWSIVMHRRDGQTYTVSRKTNPQAFHQRKLELEFTAGFVGLLGVLVLLGGRTKRSG